MIAPCFATHFQTLLDISGHENKLSIWDLHHLLLLLVNVATKWKEIGGGLHFSKHNLNVIGKKLVCIVGGPVQCLREILAQWLGCNKPPATTCVLTVVLRHPSVNEGQLADTLERTFYPAGMYNTYYHTVTVSFAMFYETTSFLRLPSWCK